ncbi:MAG: redoxin domain-containing protein [Phaeodactylibacter sp.]|nr:redoxin domain-containing protein [Phaeodactylibacter sp.]
MKSLSFFTLIGIMSFFSSHLWVDEQAGGVDIQIHVSGMASGYAYLTGVYKNVQSTVDSAQGDINGRFHFQRKERFEPGAYLVILPDSSTFQILLDDDQSFYLKTNAGSLEKDMQVEGSQVNELFFQARQLQYEQQAAFEGMANQNNDPAFLEQQRALLIGEYDAYLQSLFEKYPQSLFTKIRKAEQNPQIPEVRQANGVVDPSAQLYLYRSHFWDMVDFSDPRLLHTPVIFNKLITYFDNLTPPQTDAMIEAINQLMEQVPANSEYYRFFAEWIAQDFRPPYSPVLDPEAIFIHMVNEYLTDERAFWADSTQVYAWKLRATGKAGSLVGNPGMDIRARDTEGNMRSMFDIEAPYIAIYFYHAECEHCIAETPRLVQFYREWKDKGLEVFAVAMDTEDAEWKTFIADNQMDWINVNDAESQEIYKDYYVMGAPTIYLLNPSRTIIGKNLQIEHIPMIIQMDQQQRVR